MCIVAGWWYHSCHEVNLNGLWCKNGICNGDATAAGWKSFRGWDYSMKTIYMKLGRDS